MPWLIPDYNSHGWHTRTPPHTRTHTWKAAQPLSWNGSTFNVGAFEVLIAFVCVHPLEVNCSKLKYFFHLCDGPQHVPRECFSFPIKQMHACYLICAGPHEWCRHLFKRGSSFWLISWLWQDPSQLGGEGHLGVRSWGSFFKNLFVRSVCNGRRAGSWSGHSACGNLRPTPMFPILTCFPWVPRAVLFGTSPVALRVWPFSSRSELLHLSVSSLRQTGRCAWLSWNP